MTEPTELIATIELPYRRRLKINIAEYDSGMKMARLVFKEGTRITQIDLDRERAAEIAAQLTALASQID